MHSALLQPNENVQDNGTDFVFVTNRLSKLIAQQPQWQWKLVEAHEFQSFFIWNAAQHHLPPPSLRMLRYCFTKISMGKWICQGHFVALIGPFHWIIRKSKVEYILKWAEKSTGFSIKCLEWSQWTWRKFNYNLKWSPLKHSEHSETLRHSMWHCKNWCQKRILNLNLNINANKIYNCTYCLPMITNYEWNQTSINTYQTGNYSNAKVSAFFGIHRDLFDFDCHMKVITSHKLHRRIWQKKSCNRKNKKRSNECQPTFGSDAK